jgi:hypothetical protein
MRSQMGNIIAKRRGLRKVKKLQKAPAPADHGVNKAFIVDRERI